MEYFNKELLLKKNNNNNNTNNNNNKFNNKRLYRLVSIKYLTGPYSQLN